MPRRRVPRAGHGVARAPTGCTTSSPWRRRGRAPTGSTRAPVRRPSRRSAGWRSTPRCSTSSSPSDADSPRAPSSTTCRCCRRSLPPTAWSACGSPETSSTWACPKGTVPPWPRSTRAFTLKPPMRSTPLAPLLCALAVAACQDLSSKPTPYMLLNPVLDSLVVGDQSPPPSVTYYDGQRGSLTPAPSELTWSSTDTSAVRVWSLAVRRDGLFSFSVMDTAITHVGGPIRAVNYSRSNGRLAFRLRGTYAPSGTTQQVVQITLPDSVIRVGSYAIDSLSPAEAVLGFTQPAVICDPPRAWALWSDPTPRITRYFRRRGRVCITQLTPVANRQAITRP